MLRSACLALALALSASSTAQPETAQPDSPPPLGLSDSMQVSLLTMMPGDAAYSLFGHSALRIRDDASGLDRTYNFGVFDFDQPFFVGRFLRGSLDYQLATAPFDWLLMDYELQERPIIEQTLALSPTTSRELYDLLEINALPKNRSYRYDFFWDNCSTRLLAAIDSALTRTGYPASTLPPPDSPQTFRQLLKPYIQGWPSLDLGLNLALAVPGDRVATSREETFLPLELAHQLDRATVGGRSLVASRDTVFWLPDTGLPERAFPWPLVVGWIVFGIVAAWTVANWRAPSQARWPDAVLFGLVGVSGLILFLLWVATTHDVMGPNLNLLWAWPTHLVAAWMVGRSSWRRYFAVAAVGTGLALLGWVFLPQQLPAAVVPFALAITLRAAILAWRAAPVHQLEDA
ncbi:MAG: DUF4105 domain-containing protein [Bacteroidota bacterium]